MSFLSIFLELKVILGVIRITSVKGNKYKENRMKKIDHQETRNQRRFHLQRQALFRNKYSRQVKNSLSSVNNISAQEFFNNSDVRYLNVGGL